MLKKISVEENWQASLSVQRDTAQMLGVNGDGNVVRNDCTPSASAHDGYKNVTRSDGIALQFSILRCGNESKFVPAKLI